MIMKSKRYLLMQKKLNVTLKRVIVLASLMIFVSSCADNSTSSPDSSTASLLQYSVSEGHVLGFSTSSMYVVAPDHLLRIDLLGSAVDPQVDDSDERKSNKDIKSFQRVTYPKMWPGITVIYEPDQEAIVKSSFYICAGIKGNPVKQIRLRYNRPVRLDSQGNLRIQYERGEMIESAPTAWQEVEGEKKAVNATYRIIGKQEIGFIADYDPRFPLIIDPALEWNSFIGGGDGPGVGEADTVTDIVLDAAGNIYLSGYSACSWGSPLNSFTGSYDAFVAKVDSDGILLWHTFLGGTLMDEGRAIVLDASGNIYIGGWSYATWGSPVRAFSGDREAFAAKLDSSGTLLWNTFLGSAAADSGYDIVVDGLNNIYLAGSSYATWSSPLRSYSTGSDGFVAKLNAGGSLVWNTFLGGSSTDSGSSIDIDASGNVYVGGSSLGTWGAPVRAHSGGYYDAYAAKLNNGGTLLWNTFLGGGLYDVGYVIRVDSSGNVFVGGYSESSWGLPIRPHTNSSDAYVAKLDTNGTLQWNTYLGGSTQENCTSITFDSSGNIIIGGRSAEWGTPINSHAGFHDAFAAKLTTGGSLIWHTFMGSSNYEYGMSIATNNSGDIYLGGFGEADWGSPIQSYTADRDGFLAKLDENGIFVWHTFLGGAAADYGYAVTSDIAGNVYLGGTSNHNWGTPLNAYVKYQDVLIAKLDSSGNKIWHTFFGGGSTEYCRSITVDNTGNIYVVGYCYGSWGTPILPYSGSSEAFVAKLNSSGTLLWNTFLGSLDSDEAYGIALDGSGNIYVAGFSYSTWGSPINAHSGRQDIFTAKLDNNGNLLWNTFHGSADWDYGRDIDVDSTGNVYISGYSDATWGAPIRTFTSQWDAVAVKLDTNGILLWNTFLGNINEHRGYSIAVDNLGNAYVGGRSNYSWGSPVRAYTNGYDSFAAKLNTSGVLQWNTFVGGNGNDYFWRIGVDGYGNAYVTGESDATWSSPERLYSGDRDAYVAKVDASGVLLWNTFLGGTSSDNGGDIYVNVTGTAYVVGTSRATWGTPVDPFAAYYDAFVAKIDNSPLGPPTCTITQTATRTPTPTRTNTGTYTPTPTETLFCTSTPTATVTPTATISPTVTITPTYTASPTITCTATITPTSTWTATATVTPPYTATPTYTVTSTATTTMTHSPTKTITPTWTVSLTCSPTQTNTPTSTITMTYTITKTATRTSTNTPTTSPSVTLTVSSTPTNTATPTYSPTSTNTPVKLNTPTATKTHQINTFGKEILAYPNPLRDTVFFSWRETTAEKVVISIYNMAGERIAILYGRGSQQLLSWDASSIAPGIYLYQTILTIDGREKRLGIKKIAVVR
jgi:uncharacterized delta-60 repeat protein